MKKVLLLLFLVTTGICKAQFETTNLTPRPNLTIDPKVVYSVGVLHGGGGLVGLDTEFKLAPHLGFQVGGGIIASGFSCGAGIDIHFTPSIKSSMLSLQYVQQGIGSKKVQSLFGPVYVYRAPKWFTFSIGIGAVVDRGPLQPSEFAQQDAMLLYAFGVHFW